VKPRRRVLGRHLSIKSEYLESILSGDKVTTIRKGIITPKYTRVLLHSGGKIVGEVEIESVRYLQVKDLTRKDALRDGFKSREELLEKLKKHYPDLSPEDWVTILEFRLIRRLDERENEIYQGYSIEELARLALAYNVLTDPEERRILALIAVKGSLREVARELGGLKYRKLVRKVIRKAVRRLVDKGII